MKAFMSVFALLFVLICYVESATSKKEAHCGIPTFIDNFPAAEKAKVLEIWKDYQKGQGCEDKRADTKKILASLPPAERKRVLFHTGPAFLKGATAEVRKQFEDIWNDHSIPRTQKPAMFEELAEKLLNPTQMVEFNKYLDHMKKSAAEFETKVANLSPEARAIHEKLDELRKQRHELYKNATESVRKELEDLYKHDKKRNGRF